MSLITLGTVAIDNITTHVGTRPQLLGGSAAHFAMSARLFTKVHIVSIVGSDFPRDHITFLKKRGVDTTSIIEREGKSFQWEGEYRAGDLNSAITLSTELGVLLNYSPQVAGEHRSIGNIFLANFDPDIQMEFFKLMKKPRFVGMDTMNLWIEHKRKSVEKMMKKVHLFVANDAEARALSGESNLLKAAKALRKMGPQYITIKKGENGVIFYSDKFKFAFAAYPVEDVIDPTGAGDTFAGGLMGYLTKAGRIDEKTLKKAIIYATTLSSYNVEGFGMEKTAPLTLKKIEKRMKELASFISP